MSVARTIEICLVPTSRCVFLAELVDRSGAALNLTDDYRIEGYIFERATDSAEDALVMLSSESGSIIVLDTPGTVACELYDEDCAKLSPQQLFYCVLNLIDINSETVANTNSFFLFANPAVFSMEANGMPSLVLSTRFVNTLSLLGEAGGEGYLDGLSTVNQPVGCYVQFTVTGSQPQQWQLVAGTTVTSAGAVRRPLDFNASTNAKVWVRIS